MRVILISEGIPKPLIYTPEWIAKMFAMADPPAAQGFVDPSEYFMKGNFMCNLPPFHVSQASMFRRKM
jgi:hypothetical protein